MPFCSRAVQLPRRFLPTTTVGGAGLHEGGSPSFMIIILLTANGMLLSRPPPNPYGSKSAAQDRWVATREYLPLVKTVRLVPTYSKPRRGPVLFASDSDPLDGRADTVSSAHTSGHRASFIGNSRKRPAVLEAASSSSFQQSVSHSLRLMRSVVYERASDIVRCTR